jgi:hypothetical protein
MEGASRVGCRRNLITGFYQDPALFKGRKAIFPKSSGRRSMKADEMDDVCCEVYHMLKRGIRITRSAP